MLLAGTNRSVDGQQESVLLLGLDKDFAFPVSMNELDDSLRFRGHRGTPPETCFFQPMT
jgi:hypothetical protein